MTLPAPKPELEPKKCVLTTTSAGSVSVKRPSSNCSRKSRFPPGQQASTSQDLRNLDLRDLGSMSSASSSSAPFLSPMEYFARLLSARTASPRSMFAISPSCTGPTAGITKSVQIPQCTPPCPVKNPRPLKVRNGATGVSPVRRAGRPALHQQASLPVQKFRRTRNGITTTASSATGFPPLTAGTNFQRARAFAAKESRRSSGLFRTRMSPTFPSA